MKYIEFRSVNNIKESIDNSIFWYNEDDNSCNIFLATNLLQFVIDLLPKKLIDIQIKPVLKLKIYLKKMSKFNQNILDTLNQISAKVETLKEKYTNYEPMDILNPQPLKQDFFKPKPLQPDFMEPRPRKPYFMKLRPLQPDFMKPRPLQLDFMKPPGFKDLFFQGFPSSTSPLNPPGLKTGEELVLLSELDKINNELAKLLHP